MVLLGCHDAGDGWLYLTGLRFTTVTRRGTHPHSDHDRFDDFESITKAYDAGATDFIVKPLNAMLLTHRIRYMVRANQVLELWASQATLTQAEMPRWRAPDSNLNSWRP